MNELWHGTSEFPVPCGVPKRCIAADLRVRLWFWSCGWQHRGLAMVWMLYLVFVR
jgi:hypothetical protein